MDPFDRLGDPTSTRVYSRKCVGPTTITAVGARKVIPPSQGEDDWEKLKNNWGPKPANEEELVLLKQTSLAKPPAPRRSLSEGQQPSSSKTVAEKDVFDFDDFETLSISKTSMNLIGKPIPASVIVNPYDFDNDLDLPKPSQSLGSSASSSYGSSQESNKSTGSAKRISPDSYDETIFRKPQQPVAKVKGPVPVAKGESFPPGRKRPAPKSTLESRPKKISPDKPEKASSQTPSCDLIPSTSRGPVPTTAKSVNKSVIQAKKDIMGNNRETVAGTTRMECDAISVSPGSDTDEQFPDAESEIAYLLDRLNVNGNSLMTRCLNAIKLSRKLIDPTFRVHFFAHAPGKVYDLLKDAPHDPNLRLCCAAIVLVLSTDSLKMNVDETAMELLSDIIKKDEPERQKLDAKIFDGVAGVVSQSKFRNELERSHITASRLVLEALMKMKLGSQWPWFMDEIRHKGFLDHLIKHLRTLQPVLESKLTLSNISALTRLMDFFFKVMHRSKENSEYLVSGCGSSGLKSLVHLVAFSFKQLTSKKHPAEIKGPLASLLHLIFLVLANASFHAELLRDMMGSDTNLIELSINCCTGLGHVVPRGKYQDILLQAVPCLVNLTHNCESNCHKFVGILPVSDVNNRKSSIHGFVRLVKDVHEAAESSGDDLERCTDRLLTKMDTSAVYTDLMEKAGENLEQFSIMSYVGILLSHLLTFSDAARGSLHQDLVSVFGTVSAGMEILTGAIKRVADMLASVINHDGNSLPVHDMHTAIDVLEGYERSHRPV